MLRHDRFDEVVGRLVTGRTGRVGEPTEPFPVRVGDRAVEGLEGRVDGGTGDRLGGPVPSVGRRRDGAAGQNEAARSTASRMAGGCG